MSNRVATQAVRTPTKAWVMLALGVAAQAAGTLLVSTPAYLIPMLHAEQGMPLAQAGLLAAAPTFGMVLTLVVWGALADRFGERWIIAGGLALTALFAFAAVPVDGYAGLAVVLMLGGAAAASTNAASGRVVVGWFPRERRGLAIGFRQMSQPIGVGIAAVSIAVIADVAGVHAALWVPTIGCALAAALVAAVVVDPPRPARRTGEVVANPYRQDSYLA